MMPDDNLTLLAAASLQADVLGAAEAIRTEELSSLTISGAANLDDALSTLDSGECDLVAAAALDLRARGELESGLEVIGGLALRDWNHIIVSEDRPSHLPHRAIVLSETRLQRRQLRRYRSDMRVRDAAAHAALEEVDLPDEVAAGDAMAFFEWAEGLRQAGDIDGYVIARHLHRVTGAKTRRHALSHDPKENELIRFLPTPLAGMVVLVARTGFPASIANELTDIEGTLAHELSTCLLDGIDEQLHDRLGMMVRNRQPGPMLREAERRRDLFTQEVLKNLEGELVQKQPKVEICIELLDRRGRASVSMERLCDLDSAMQTTRFLLGDWKKLLRLTAEVQPELPGRGPESDPFLDL